MNKSPYTNWSTSALEAFIVMTESMMSGTRDETLHESYRQKILDAQRELLVKNEEADPASQKRSFFRK